MRAPRSDPALAHPLPEPVTVQIEDAGWWQEVLARVWTIYDAAAEARPWLESRDCVSTLCAKLGFCGQSVVDVSQAELENGEDLWFIGDVHGDLLGLEVALAVIRRRSGERARIVFLGDLVDDGFHCAEVISRVLDLVLGQGPDPGEFEISLVAGNHDEALEWDDAGPFSSHVKPGDFSVWLNRNLDWVALGRAYVELVARLPRALFFPHGLLATHAGFPHSDTWSRIAAKGGVECMQDPDMLRDFSWNRLAQSKRKLPNRGSIGSSFGSADFEGFCEVAGRALGYPIAWMVRGHDHISTNKARFSRPRAHRRWAYEGRVLTVNNMCYALPRETGLDFGELGIGRLPTLVHWRVELGAPTPVAIEIPEGVIDEYVSPCEACGQAIPRRARGFVHDCEGPRR